ncbi:MAG: sulfur-carrier protein [Methanolobus sp.]|jgi:molybdopterin synthase sulfur carrier subunit|uniref:MoaD family protein n=1 Tax=Methanolobus tindarius DSM 2278 TaxID=1090322 RepID=W9DQE5_METTI|nr:ubiquitin-like small modifier protein 1 [Methanolobus tindarius]ETA67673.1 MoaD family protein [Methanolobus tindarius DSM 2278]MDK2939045.1 sulfur-carrier protein [Methanolobus sp.]
MANVKVKLFANLREIAQTSSLSLTGDSVKEVLLSLTEQYPALKELVFEAGTDAKLCGYINVFLNGNNIKHMEGLETVLSDDDELGIFPPVSGG